MVNATFEQRTRYFTLPFISNYIRDENNQVYCTDTHNKVGIWDNARGVIVIDGDYYHGPPVIASQNGQQQEVVFRPVQYPSSASPQYDFFADEPTMERLDLADLDVATEEGEITELFPIEGATQFRQTLNGQVYFAPDQETELVEEAAAYSIGFTVVKTLMGCNYQRKDTKIKLFPQYRHMEAFVENRNVLVRLSSQ